MNAYKIFLIAHIVSGCVALASFWAAAALRKGSLRHRLVGRVYVVAMLSVMLSGTPLAYLLVQRGQPVGGLFLYFLLILTFVGTFNAWRAIRFKREPGRYFDASYWTLHLALAVAGIGIIALGVVTGAVLLQVFGGVGVMALLGAIGARRRSATDPAWWLREHYSAIIGNGIATHIAFFGIGLRNALPFVDPQVQQQLAWFTPLVAGLVATVWMQRKYGRKPTRARITQPVVALRAEPRTS